MDFLHSNSFVLGGVLISIFGTLFIALKSVPKLIFEKMKSKYLKSIIIYDYDELFLVIEKWIFENYNGKYKTMQASYSKDNNYYNNSKDDEQKKIFYKQDSNFFFIKYKGKNVLIIKTKEKTEHAQDSKNLWNYHYVISCLNNSELLKSLLEEINDWHNDSMKSNEISFFSTDYSEWRFATKKMVKPLSKTILNKEDKETLIKDIIEFKENKQWYNETNIPYKRTYCFYGFPGTGKTTLSFAIAAELKRNIYVLNLQSISNDKALQDLFCNIPSHSVMLIEDIDSPFVKRENKDQSKISFSCLLNCLDGAFSKEGIVTIITTNHIEKLDPALIREGRVNIKMEIKYASSIEIKEYFNIFYGENISMPDQLEAPISFVQEQCMINRDDPHAALNKIIEIVNLKQIQTINN